MTQVSSIINSFETRATSVVLLSDPEKLASSLLSNRLETIKGQIVELWEGKKSGRIGKRSKEWEVKGYNSEMPEFK